MKRFNTLVLSYLAVGFVAACGDVSPTSPAKSGGSGGDSGAGSSNPACPTGYVCTPAQTPGATSVASEIQETASSLASDGTTLFWSSDEGGAISSMPVEGGMISTLAAVGGLVAVDGTNLYYIPSSGVLTRMAKAGGGAPSPVGEGTSPTEGVTVLGTTAYWLERPSGIGGMVTVKSAPLQGGAATVIATLNEGVSPNLALGVTTTTVFLGTLTGLTSFPIASGVPDGGMGTLVSGVPDGCNLAVSDSNAIYCGTYGTSLLSIASNGAVTTLGTLLAEGETAGAGGVAFDDTDVYWVDAVTVGTIMKAPKAGGSATIVARDTSPVALAIDANAIYWSDVGGNIMRLPK